MVGVWRSDRTARAFGFTTWVSYREFEHFVEECSQTLLVPICALAVLMSFSRSGVLVLLVSCVTALFLLLNAGRLSRQTFAVLTASGLAVCLGLSIYGYDSLSSRFESAKSVASLNDRSRLWTAACEGFGDHLLCGTGLSSHRFIYPMYLTPQPGDDPSLFYTHAENGYVQIALETGAVGLGLALASMAFYFFWCATSLSGGCNQRSMLCFVAVLPALLANAVHSVTDFVWYVPGCMGVIAILGACACRLYQLDREQAGFRQVLGGSLTSSGQERLLRWWPLQSSRFPRSGMVSWQTPLHRYLALKRSLVRLNCHTAYDEIQANSEERKEILIAQLDELENVLDERPNWAEAHACKTEVHRKLFHEFQATSDNPYNMRMIRDTVMNSCGSLEAALEWLPRGVGPHYIHLNSALLHARRAVQLGPLQGKAYLILAELSFLEEGDVPTNPEYVRQAYAVRPNHGDVLFEIGSEVNSSGHFQEGLAFWKRSFQRGPEYQDRIIQALTAVGMPANQIIQVFHPDADAMQIMLQHYRRPELKGELECVLAANATACESKARGL